MEKVIEIRRELERGRTSTEELLRPVSDDELVAQLSPQTPPLVWMLAHVAPFEEPWIPPTIGGAQPIPDVHDHVYGAFRRERQNGAKLPNLKPSAVRAYATDVRERSLEMLHHTPLDPPASLL